MTSGPLPISPVGRAGSINPITGSLVVRSRSRIRRIRIRRTRRALLTVVAVLALGVVLATAGVIGSALGRGADAGTHGGTGMPEILGGAGGSKIAGPAPAGGSDGPFAAEYAGRALRPDLAAALRSASAAAAREGLSLSVTSGFRSWQAQQRLFDQAVRRHGNAVEAARWVLPPERSLHVQGRAVDVGDEAAARWLEANGSAWGLCRRYENEWWHFELRTAPGGSCPPLSPDAGG